MIRFVPRLRCIAAAAALAATATHAQLVDTFDVRREGDDAVLQLRFATEVQFQRAVTTRAGDLTLVFYTLVDSTNSIVRSRQGLQLGLAEGLPRMTLNDEPARGERERRLVLRVAEATPLDARAGPGNRSIEIVLRGAGARVVAQPRPAPAAADVTPATLPAADRRFVILLQSTASRDAPAVRVPAALQNYEVFTRERLVDGVRRYETLVGYFSNRTQADAVLQQLRGLPQAMVIAADVPVPLARSTEPPAVPPAAAPAASAPAVTVVPFGPKGPEAPLPMPAPLAADAQPLTPEQIDQRADALMAAARAAFDRGEQPAAIASLNTLLNLPPNRNTQAAQELVGLARARAGELARARVEFETYLQLYPSGEGAERVRRELAALPAAPARAEAPVPERPAVETTTSGSASMSYIGGNGQIRSQDFKDSPLGGVPQTAGDPLFTPDKSRQIYNDVDLTWRRRSAEEDLRFVFRDSYITDLERSDKSRQRLSALYVDYKSLSNGYGVRLGRQSPTGGGVMGRFDGISANVTLRPRLKLAAVAGTPADKYFDAKRRFYGASIDADAWLPNFGTTLYAIQQSIDAETDRRAVGLEMRYFKDGASVFSQFDYDLAIRGLNVATVQATLVTSENTVFNALYDRRALPMLALGNALTFGDPTNPGVLYARIADALANTTLAALRSQIRRTTPYVTQLQGGVTTPLDKTWQLGLNGQVTSTTEIPPVPEVAGFENGRPATGRIWSGSTQLIGQNLYSQRDTHVLSGTAIRSAALMGWLLAYNNSSIAWDVWQVEPSLQYYRDRAQGNSSNTNVRWTPGLRVTYRGWAQWALESALTYELGKSVRSAPDPVDPTLVVTTRESSTRVNYSLGARYSF